MYNRKTMKSALESLMFVWGEPLAVKDAAEVLDAGNKEIKELFEELMTEYELEGRGIRIREVKGAYQYVTHVENEIFIEKMCTPVKVKRLSQAALEVLAIIAYRQPVTRGEIDSIRGVKSERVIEGLLNKDLIEPCGRSEGVGRPMLYRTTIEFLKKFGFTSLKDLPDIAEFDELRNRDEEGVGMHEQISLNFELSEEEVIKLHESIDEENDEKGEQIKLDMTHEEAEDEAAAKAEAEAEAPATEAEAEATEPEEAEPEEAEETAAEEPAAEEEAEETEEEATEE